MSLNQTKLTKEEWEDAFGGPLNVESDNEIGGIQ